MDELAFIAEMPKKEQPKYQPACYVPDNYTLSIPPSETFKIVKSKPQLRRQLNTNDSAACLSTAVCMDNLTKADKIGDIKPLVGSS